MLRGSQFLLRRMQDCIQQQGARHNGPTRKMPGENRMIGGKGDRRFSLHSNRLVLFRLRRVRVGQRL